MNKIWISVGQNRKETRWKNQELSWPGLVKKLSVAVITNETHDEYMAMKKSQQDAIKDVGGFVGGVITGGRRKASAVTNRYLITLDLDKVSSTSDDFADDYMMMFGTAAVIYSTHKHAEGAERLRLVIPLSREIHSDEYEAVSRKIAETLDMDRFDPTTFQAERLMYWPSASKDIQYYFREIEGEWLDPDKILEQYSDWKDTSQWPVSSHIDKVLKRSMSRQGDPLEKPGIIGVFCRVYGIGLAIEKFLGDIYLATGYDDRYTYAHGSTTAGIVVYDDKFSFSHHSTDPCAMKLCNAFDLVRLHLFGDLDSDADDKATDIAANRRPSFIKMTELASKDKAVKRILLTEKIELARSEFGDGKKPTNLKIIDIKDDSTESEKTRINATGGALSELEVEEDMSWTEKMDTNRFGNCESTINNAILVLENDSSLKGCLAYNDFDKRISAVKDFAWRKVAVKNDTLTDADDAAIRHYLESVYKITGKDKISDAIDIVSRRNSFHPVKDYLSSCVWDGEERLDTILIDMLGADDTEYIRTVTRKTFVAAVARIQQPGVKFDNMVILLGKQGVGKSYLIDKMGGFWFSDTFGALHNKDAMEQLQGVWIMEVGELAGIKTAEVETIKLFIAKREDRFRVSYGKRVEGFPRQCIFIGTTNNKTPLRDHTGGRRFWVVELDEDKAIFNVFDDMSPRIVSQLWAEAQEYYNRGEKLYLPKEIETMAKEVQEKHLERDERDELITKYLSTKVPGNWSEMNAYDRINFLQGDELSGPGTEMRYKISVPEIWIELFRNQTKDMSVFNTRFIRNAMNQDENWTSRVVKTDHYGAQRGWILKKILVTKICNNV